MYYYPPLYKQMSSKSKSSTKMRSKRTASEEPCSYGSNKQLQHYQCRQCIINEPVGPILSLIDKIRHKCFWYGSTTRNCKKFVHSVCVDRELKESIPKPYNKYLSSKFLCQDCLHKDYEILRAYFDSKKTKITTEKDDVLQF